MRLDTLTWWLVLLKVICQDHIANKCQKHKHNSSLILTASPESVHHALHITEVIFTVFPFRTEQGDALCTEKGEDLGVLGSIRETETLRKKPSWEQTSVLADAYLKVNALLSTSEGSNSSKLEKQAWHGLVYQSEMIEIQGWEKKIRTFIFQILCATRCCNRTVPARR